MSREMTRNTSLSLALMVACGLTASAGAQTPWVHVNHRLAGNHGTQTPRWMVRATDHFDIYIQRQHERALDEIAREAERAYARVSVDLRHELAAKVPLIVVETAREMPQNRGQAGTLVRASGAPDGDHLLLALEPSDGRATVLVHELTHQFDFELVTFNRVPGWAHEGLADHETGTWTASELVKLRESIAAGAVPTVASLGDSDRLWGHALFDFVAAEYGTRGIRQYLSALGNNSPAGDAALAAFGIPASDFDRAFQTYLRTHTIR
jgi:hypothetical protein